MICYDIEFPELGRIAAAEEVDIICVPFWTDTKNGYLASAWYIPTLVTLTITGPDGVSGPSANVDVILVSLVKP